MLASDITVCKFGPEDETSGQENDCRTENFCSLCRSGEPGCAR